ncbi:hypothetical protein D1872_222440 [compost metagenome]
MVLPDQSGEHVPVDDPVRPRFFHRAALEIRQPFKPLRQRRHRMLTGLYIQRHPAMAYIGAVGPKRLQVFPVKAGFRIHNLAFLTDVNPDMLQVIEVLDVVVIVNRVFEHALHLRVRECYAAPERKGILFRFKFRHPDPHGKEGLPFVHKQPGRIP